MSGHTDSPPPMAQQLLQCVIERDELKAELERLRAKEELMNERDEVWGEHVQRYKDETVRLRAEIERLHGRETVWREMERKYAASMVRKSQLKEALERIAEALSAMTTDEMTGVEEVVESIAQDVLDGEKFEEPLTCGQHGILCRIIDVSHPEVPLSEDGGQ